MPAKAKPKRREPSRADALVVELDDAGLIPLSLKFKPVVAAKAHNRTGGKTLCPRHLEPVHYGEAEGECGCALARGETVKGFPRPDGGGYVVVDDAVLDELAAEKAARVKVEAVLPVDAIDPALFEKPYLTWPQEGAEQVFAVVAAHLRSSRQAIVVTVVVSKSTRAMLLRWSDRFATIVGHTIQYDEIVRWNEVDEVQALLAGLPKPEKAAVALVKQLLETKPADFHPDLVSDVYGVLLDEAIAAAAAGKPQPKATGKAKETAQVGDLLAALQASVAAAQAKPKKREAVPA
jgi:DNA end-binding protein Ku